LGGPLDDSHECGFMVEEADEVRPVKIVPYLRQVVYRPGLFYQISRPFCRNHGFTLPSLENLLGLVRRVKSLSTVSTPTVEVLWQT
jgi:hypothetical protein